MKKQKLTLAAALFAALFTAAPAFAAQKLLNVSYDVSRNFYKDLNPAFIASW